MNILKRGIMRVTAREMQNCFTAMLCGVLLGFPAIVAAQSVGRSIEYISPVPGSTMVSQETNIIIGTKKRLEPMSTYDPSMVSVLGSTSGSHGVSITLSDDETRLIIKPFRAFAASETVSVAFRPALRTVDGERIESIDFHFTVSALSGFDQRMLLWNISEVFVPRTLQFDRSAPPQHRLEKAGSDSLPADFPKRTIVTLNNPSPGRLFLGTFKIAEASDHLAFITYVPSDQQYLMILDNSAKPVFYRKMPSMSTDFKLQPNGYLTYFDNAAGAYYELDSNYVVVDSFRCGNGYRTDLHELRVLPDGHHLMLGYDPQRVDMSTVVPAGNPSAIVHGAVIQELDRNRNVIFQWRSFDHFKITDATREDFTAENVDYVHPNTIEIDTDGNLLLSCRHMDEITKIDRRTGAIIWRWGGKNNQFKYLGDSVGFSHQHTIGRTPTGTLLMLDNGNYRRTPYSSVVEYQVDEAAKTCRLVWQYRHSPDVLAIAMASARRLPNGNTLIGWGTTNPAVTEVRPDGSTAFELQLADSIVSYRAFRSDWNPPSRVASIVEKGSLPVSVWLEQNYPNPFNPSTTINFRLPEAAHVTVKIINTLGQVMATLMDEHKEAGYYQVRWNATKAASGVYFYRLQARPTDGGQARGASTGSTQGFVETKKMILLR